MPPQEWRRGQGYFSILQLGNACCSSVTPALVTWVLWRLSVCRLVNPLRCAMTGGARRNRIDNTPSR